MAVSVKLTKGMTAVVSDVDQDLAKHKWTARHCGNVYYAYHRVGGRAIDLHRVVLERKIGRPLQQGEWTDHANCNSLDNRRSNLRVSTRSQNAHNQPKKQSASCTSQFKGVCYNKSLDKWEVEIRCSGKRHRLGYYDSETKAALAYNEKAIELLGEFAHLNKVES